MSIKIADIDKETRKLLYGAPQVKTVDDAMMSSGAPMFTESDIHVTQHCLDIILRSIFVKKRITREYFNSKCREKALQSGCLPQQANTPGSNLIRTIIAGNITMNRFIEVLKMLDWTLADMSVTIKTSGGSEDLFGVLDTVQPE